MNEDTVEPQEMIEHDNFDDNQVSDEDYQEEESQESESEQEERMVPLSALQKERKKRQEMEYELNYVRQQGQRSVSEPEPEDDTSEYETATRGDLRNVQTEAVRIVEEKLWIKQNPEKHQFVSENLQEFLKQRPNLAGAIQMSSNRFEEAYTLMNALTPKQQQALKTGGIKKVSPNSPNTIPKSASLNGAIDVMNMSDQEFSAWRMQQRRKR